MHNIKNPPAVGWANVGLLGISHFVADFYCNVLPILLPLLAVKFGFSYAACGSLFMAFQVVASFLQPPLGLMADRKSINWIMPVSIITSGILVCAVFETDSVLILILIVIMSGLCSSGFHPVAGGIVPLVAPKNKDILATSIFIAGGNIGFALAPTLVAFYLHYVGQEDLLYLSAPALITAALIFMRRLHIKAKPSGLIALPNVHEIVRNQPFMIFILGICLRAWSYCAMVIYLALVFTEMGYNLAQSSSGILAMLLGVTAGGLIIGSLSLRFGMKQLIIMTLIVSIAAETVFVIKADLSVISYIALFVMGAGLYGSTPVAIVWSERMLSGSAAFSSSMILGFTFGVGYVASVISGYIGDYIGLLNGIAITTIPSLIAALVIFMFLKEPPAPDAAAAGSPAAPAQAPQKA